MACDTVGTCLYQQKYSLGLSSSGGKMNRLTACFSLGRLEVFGSIQDTKRQIFALCKTQSHLMRWSCGVGEVTGDWRFRTTCQSKSQRSQRCEKREDTLQNMIFPGSVFARCIDPRVGLDYSEMTCYSESVSAPGQLVFVVWEFITMFLLFNIDILSTLQAVKRTQIHNESIVKMAYMTSHYISDFKSIYFIYIIYIYEYK